MSQPQDFPPSPYDDQGQPRTETTQWDWGGGTYQQAPGYQAPGYQTPEQPGAAWGAGTWQGQPVMQPDEKGWAIAAHLSPLVALYLSAGWLGVVAPLIIWAVYKDTKPFVRQAAAGAFNFSVTLLLANVVATVIAIVTLGVGVVVSIPIWVAIVIAAFICHILGAVRAADAQVFRYPLQVPILS